jgi:hypothetical protein
MMTPAEYITGEKKKLGKSKGLHGGLIARRSLVRKIMAKQATNKVSIIKLSDGQYTQNWKTLRESTFVHRY